MNCWAAEDEQMRTLLTRKDNVEALSWLTAAPRGVERNVSEMTHHEAVALVRRLYEWGATEVLAVQIGRSPDRRFESTDTLIVVLPDDAVARTRIILWNNQRSFEMGYEDAEEERGQRHLLVWFG